MIVKDLSKEFYPVPKPLQKNKKTAVEFAEKSAEIKKKSNKLAKLERERDKKINKEGYCEFCGRYSNRLDPHEVYGGANRKRSIKKKFVALLCRKCHDNEEILNILKVKYQKEYEITHTREEFIKLIGKSYIKGQA